MMYTFCLIFIISLSKHRLNKHLSSKADKTLHFIEINLLNCSLDYAHSLSNERIHFFSIHFHILHIGVSSTFFLSLCRKPRCNVAPMNIKHRLTANLEILLKETLRYEESFKFSQTIKHVFKI